MNRIVKGLLAILVIGACSNIVLAGEAFTPLNFSDATYQSGGKSTVIAANTTENKPAAATVSDTVGNKNMQSAISQLDNAQVEVRNELMKYKEKYTDVDARYNTVKSERERLKKQIKACEKKIKKLDNTKNQIRKSMQ